MKYSAVMIDGKGKKKDIGMKLGTENPNTLMNLMKNASGIKARLLSAMDKMNILKALRTSENEGPQQVELNEKKFEVFTVGVITATANKKHDIEDADLDIDIDIEESEDENKPEDEKPTPLNGKCFECGKKITGKFRQTKHGLICEPCAAELAESLQETIEDATEASEKDRFIRKEGEKMDAQYDKCLQKAYADWMKPVTKEYGFEIFDDKQVCPICGKAVDPRLVEGEGKITHKHKGKLGTVHLICLRDEVKTDPTFQRMLEWEFYGFKLPDNLKRQIFELWALFEVCVHQKIKSQTQAAKVVKNKAKFKAEAIEEEDEGEGEETEDIEVDEDGEIDMDDVGEIDLEGIE